LSEVVAAAPTGAATRAWS
jgi:hypothetical protein